MKTEATIILPLLDNDGVSVASAHALLADSLIEAFGGFTSAPVAGSWRDEGTGKVYRDESTEYRVAADWSQGRNAGRLERIAARACKNARQVCVYMKDGAGEVYEVTPAEARGRPGLSFDEMAA